MKGTYISFFTAVLAVLAGTIGAEAGVLTSSGDWSTTTITADETVNLTGTVNVYGTITVKNGATLTINSNGGSYLIQNILDNSAGAQLGGIFKVAAGSTLKILGTSENKITIGGGANFSDVSSYNVIDGKGYMDPGLLVTPDGLQHRTMTQPAIVNDGILICEYVNFQNIDNVNESRDPSSGNMQLANSGGAVRHGNNGALLTKLSHCLVRKCRAVAGAGVYAASKSDGQVVIEDCEFRTCVSFADNIGLHGGVVRGYGNSAANIFLIRTNIHHCYSNVDAGAIYFPSNGTNTKGTAEYPKSGKEAKLTINGCKFYNNRAMASSGALDICANMDIVGGTTEIYNNRAEGSSTGTNTSGHDFGGGMSLRAYNSNSYVKEAVTVEYNINDKLKVYNNVAKVRGGGIAIYSASTTTLWPGSTMTINFDGAEVYGNRTIGNASGDSYGGGIWIKDDTNENHSDADAPKPNDYHFQLYLDSGSIHDNSANQGGGLYINKWTIQSNPGGTVAIKDNEAVDNGGGMYLLHAAYTMSSGEISGNTSGNQGGGIFASSNSDLTINAGNCSSNTATSNGGGLYLGVGSSVTFNGDIKENVGLNGGGIYLAAGSMMTLEGGSIVGNRAKAPDGDSSTTAYNIASGFSGFGGGIFVAKGSSTSQRTTLNITPTGTSFGLHSNTADKGGNEIVAQGVNTYVTLPKVSRMTLTGFDRAAPNWYEDYNASDDNYLRGLNLDAATNARYADQLLANTYQSHLVAVPGEENRIFEDKYICYTLGWELLKITIKATGLDAGESALVKVRYTRGAVDESFNVLLLSNGSTVSKTVKNLNYGHYDLTPLDNWSWKYTVSPASYSEDVTSEKEKTYEFTFTKKEGSVRSSESNVVNQVSRTTAD